MIGSHAVAAIEIASSSAVQALIEEMVSRWRTGTRDKDICASAGGPHVCTRNSMIRAGVLASVCCSTGTSQYCERGRHSCR